MDALLGQLRSAVELAGYSTPRGQLEFVQRQTRRPWRLRLGGAVATLRANLTLDAASFRHAIRLAVCIGAAEAIAGSLGWSRSYWMPMTIAIVLKPDFTATFSRGVLRLAGTMAGLVVTTALLHFVAPGIALHVALITLAVAVLRYIGPTNYGIFVATLSALVVLLVALAGVAPHGIIVARAVNTAAGGAIALVAYLLWPTWERTQVSEALADMLDAYRDYFHAIREAYLAPDRPFAAELDRKRMAARVTRSNAEASVDRVLAEPGVTPDRAKTVSAMLASSHRLVSAIMSLETGLSQSRLAPARSEFRTFTHDVELTLHSLASALRGSPLASTELPDLREDHHKLIASGDSTIERYALVNTEADRITNSVNTLAEQVLAWTSAATASRYRSRLASIVIRYANPCVRTFTFVNPARSASAASSCGRNAAATDARASCEVTGSHPSSGRVAGTNQ